MVPKEKAALAYRDTVRRRVDPALVEWSGAGVFQCRVFPLAPQSLHRVTIGYDVDLLRVGDDLELRLDLPGQTPATIVDLNIAAGRRPASQPRRPRHPHPRPLSRHRSPSGEGRHRGFPTGLIDPKERPLAVRLRKPGTLMLTGADEATGSYFATRVGLTLPETPSADRAKQAIFLVDTSLSAGPQFPLWTKLLRATLENNRDSIQEFAVVFFNVETFWWQEKFVANTPENVDALMNYADGLALEGATDLGRALKEAAAPAWLKKAGWAGTRSVLAQRRRGHLGRRSLAAAGGGRSSSGPAAGPETAVGQMQVPDRRAELHALRLSHRPGRRRSAVAGLPGRADGRGGLFAGGRGGDRLGLGGPSQSALAADRHRNGRRT